MSTATKRQSGVAINVFTASCGIGLLVACLAMADERIRTELAQILTGHGRTTEVGGAIGQIQQAGMGFLQSVHDQAIAYAPLATFGVAALILVILMTRVKF